MRDPARFLGRAVFGAAILGALGFGTAHALSPAAPPAAAPRAYCAPLECHNDCVYRGYMGGFCRGTSSCVCYH